MKWFFIAAGIMVVAEFGALAVSENAKAKALGECRVAALQSGKSADEIGRICK